MKSNIKNKLKDKKKAKEISKALAAFSSIQVKVQLDIPLNYLFYLIASAASDTQTACSLQSNQSAMLLLSILEKQKDNFKVDQKTKTGIEAMISFLSFTAIATEELNKQDELKRTNKTRQFKDKSKKRKGPNKLN